MDLLCVLFRLEVDLMLMVSFWIENRPLIFCVNLIFKNFIVFSLVNDRTDAETISVGFRFGNSYYRTETADLAIFEHDNWMAAYSNLYKLINTY